MSLYTLKNLIHDCASKKGRIREDTFEKRKKIYQQVWESLNNWIESRFEKGKGAHIATFAKISWETITVGRNVQKKRPFFIISEAFARNFVLPFKRKLIPPILSPLEDINFTKLAIKFSKNLTKDVVFSGIRDLLQRLGQVMGTGKQFSIKFSVGTLLGKHRISHMVFDPSKFPSLIQDMTNESIMDPPPSALGDMDDYQNLSNEMEIIENEQEIEKSLDAYETESSSQDTVLSSHPWRSHHLPLSTSSSLPDLSPSRSSPFNPFELYKSSPCDETATIHTSCEEHENEFSLAAGEYSIQNELDYDETSTIPGESLVLQQAYRRHVSNLERDIELDAKNSFELFKQQRKDIEMIEKEKIKKINDAKNLQNTIKSQMLEQDKFRNTIKDELKLLDASVCSIIPLRGNSSNGRRHDKKSKREKQSEMKKSLLQQIQEKSELREASQSQSMNEERELLNKIQSELMHQKLHDVDTRQAKRQNLIDAWRRDNHIKTVANMRRKRLQDQLQDSAFALPSEQPVDESSFAVGYDIRSEAGD